MTSSSTRTQVLALYKKLLQEGKKFTDYNFRMYAIRKTKDVFKTNKGISEPSQIQALVKEAEENLKIMQRQVLLGQLYGEGKLVIESQSSNRNQISRCC